MTDVEQIATWLEVEAAKEHELLRSDRCTNPDLTGERYLLYRAIAGDVRQGAWKAENGVSPPAGWSCLRCGTALCREGGPRAGMTFTVDELTNLVIALTRGERGSDITTRNLAQRVLCAIGTLDPKLESLLEDECAL